MKSYRSEYKLPEGEIMDIELFINYRRMIMFTVFYRQISEQNPRYLQQFKREILDEIPYLGFALDF